MKPEEQYRNLKEFSDGMKRLLAKQWVYQQVMWGNLPSSHPITAVGYIFSTFGFETSQAWSIIRETLDECNQISSSIQRYNIRSAYQTTPPIPVEPTPGQQTVITEQGDLYNHVVDEAFENLKTGIDTDDVAELLSQNIYS